MYGGGVRGRGWDGEVASGSGFVDDALERWDLTERPQTAEGNSTEWHSVVGRDQ